MLCFCCLYVDVCGSNCDAICIGYELCLQGAGMFEVYMLKSVGERTPLCGTSVLNWCCVDVVFLKVDVVCNEVMGFRYVGVHEFVNEFMYMHNVKCLVNVKCYNNCAC